MNPRAPLVAALLVLVSAFGTYAQDVDTLLRGSYLVARAPQATVKFRMTIHDAQGEKVRELVVAMTNPSRGGSMLARVVQPVSLSAMKYLRIETATGALQQWLATSRGVRRLGESGGEERLFGSDFTMDDFARIDPTDYRIARAPDRETATTWALSLQAVGGTHERKVLEIDKVSSLIMAAETLDAAGKVIRAYKVEAVAGAADSPYPHQARMSDPINGTWTLLEVLSIDLSTPIPDRTFNPAALE